MIIPQTLQPGDKVAVVAPAGRVDPNALKTGVEILKKWGLKVELGENINSGSTYFAGSDSERLQDLQNALNSTDIKAVFCARGGYGTTRILDQVDFSEFIITTKWVVGFSDITALHFKLHRLGVASIHGIMPAGFPKASNNSIESLRDVLFGKSKPYDIIPNVNDRLGKGIGEIIGGNLSLIIDSIGTDSEINFDSKILFIEEVDEYLYKVDRMLVQLKRAKKLQNLAGLIVGSFTGLKDTTVPFGNTLEEIVLSHVSDYSYPVAFGFPVGHESENLAIPHSSLVSLEVTNTRTRLSFI